VARPRRNDGTRTTVGRWMRGWLGWLVERADCGERGWRKSNEQNEGEKESNGLARHPIRHAVVARGRGDFRGRSGRAALIIPR